MDIFSLVGLVLALVALVGGSILKGAGLARCGRRPRS